MTLSSDEATGLEAALIAFTACVGEATDICSYGLTIGDSYVPFDPDEDDPCEEDPAECSQVWVRVMQITPAPGGDVGWGGECGLVLQAELEVGILRCFEAKEEGEAPTTSEVLAAAMQALSDMADIHSAAMACEVWDSILTGTWQPLGPLGGQYGGTWTFTVELSDCTAISAVSGGGGGGGGTGGGGVDPDQLAAAIEDALAALTAGDVGADPAGTAQALVDALWAQIAGGNLDTALDTLKEIGDRLSSDESAADALLTSLADVQSDLAAHNHDDRYYTKAEVDAAIAAAIDALVIPDPDLSAYATVTSVSDLDTRVTAIEDLPRIIVASPTEPDTSTFDVDDFWYDESTE